MTRALCCQVCLCLLICCLFVCLLISRPFDARSVEWLSVFVLINKFVGLLIGRAC